MAFFNTGTNGGAALERARITATGAWSFGSSGTATGTSGQVLTSNGSGSAPTWQNAAGGSNGQIQFNNSGAFGGSANFFWNNSTNRLGVGTNDPITPVTINGGTGAGFTNVLQLSAGAVANDSGPGLTFNLNYGNYSSWQTWQTGVIRSAGSNVSATYAGYLAFLTNNGGSAGDVSEKARIMSGGDLLVGTTSTASSSGTGFKVLANLGMTGHFDPAVVTPSNNTSQSCWDIYSTATSGYRFYVTTSGVVNAITTTISAISDQRLKENIQDLDVGLDAIMSLKPRKFDWRAGKGKDIKGDRGFIAQEFEQVFPDLIDEWRDPAPEGEAPYKSVRQDLIPVLVKAIQELKAQNDDLRARVAALEAK
jgi:hypothetical protein